MGKYLAKVMISGNGTFDVFSVGVHMVEVAVWLSRFGGITGEVMSFIEYVAVVCARVVSWESIQGIS